MDRVERLTKRRGFLVRIREHANGEYAESLDQQIAIVDRQLEYIRLNPQEGIDATPTD
jgi:hypothetical protein